MRRQRHLSYGFLLAAMLLSLGLAAQARAELGVGMSGMGLVFQAPAAMTGYAVQLSVNGPGDWRFVNSYQPDETILLAAEQTFTDGQYRFELSAEMSQAVLEQRAEETSDVIREGSGVEDENGRVAGSPSSAASTSRVASGVPETVAGTFRIVNGVLYVPDGSETEQDGRRAGEHSERASATSSLVSGLSLDGSRDALSVDGARSSDSPQIRDSVTFDDKIIDGSLCVGTDCYNGYAFGFDTIALLENNLRVFFDDTSTIQRYPRNDWRIVINDSVDGGGEYFAIQDATEVENIFVVEAGAPSNSLYVDDNGDVGVGTSTPYLELHIKDGDTPAVRLEQDGSYGWPKQIWDVAGNESNFFIRDATRASKLPFRIAPNTETNTLCLTTNSTGDSTVGIGTWSPKTKLHVVGGVLVQGDVETSIPSELQGVLHVEGDTYINGNLELASSRELKDHIATLDGAEAMACLKDLTPVSFEYKRTPGETQLGFIAEDAPDLVASSNRKGLNPMDIAAVLTRVVQEQQDLLGEQHRRIEILQSRLAALEARMAK